MILSALVLAAGTALAAPAPKAPVQPAEETLRVMLLKLRHNDAWQAHEAIMGSGDELRDAVSTGKGSEKIEMADRLPGMAQDPFDVCRSLDGCPQAPQSMHVEDAKLIDDAFLALARPWFKLQEARGKTVALKVDPGTGVQLTLEDNARQPVVTLEASPAPTGGFDVLLDDGQKAAQTYSAERAALLAKKSGPAS